MKNMKAIQTESGRYILTNRETGAVVDDNQGFGFKTATKAFAAYGWKTKHLGK